MNKFSILISLVILIKNIWLSSSQTSKTLFVSANYEGCNTTCTGNYDQPFDSILNVLWFYNNSDIALTIILIPNETLDHYILGAELNQDGSSYYNYTRSDVLTPILSDSNGEGEEEYSYNQYSQNEYLVFNIYSLSIKPLFCTEYNETLYNETCIDDTESVTVHIKISYLNIFSEEMEIRNIIFDGIEDIQQLQMLSQLTQDIHLFTINSNWFDNLDKCLYQRIRCCDDYDEITGFSNIFSDVRCTRLDLAFPVILKTYLTSTNFITIDSSNATKLTLTGSTIRNVWMPFNQAFFGINGNIILSVENTTLMNNSMNIGIFYFDGFGSAEFLNISFCNYVIKFDMSLGTTWVFINMMLYTEIPPDNEIISINLENMTVITSNFYMIILINGNEMTSVAITNISISCANDESNRCSNNVQYTFTGQIQALEFLNVYNVTVINSIFTNITGAFMAWNIQFFAISNCYFKNNFGFGGGAVSAWADTIQWPVPFSMDINQCIFESNVAIQGGGIYYNDNGFTVKITIRNSQFYNNYAQEGCGGGIWISVQDPELNSTFEFSNLTMINNSASAGGGIILLVDFLNTDYYTSSAGFFITLQNSTFLSNNANFGVIDTSLFTIAHFLSELDLVTTGVGGAFYLSCKGHCTTTLTNNNFTNNKADIFGGAICTSEAIIQASLFYNNSASTGGAIFAIRVNYIVDPKTDFMIISCNFINNSAITEIAYIQQEGGAIFIDIQESLNMPTIRDSIFQSNEAKQRGGAISGSAIIISTNFSFNQANLGGALSGYNYNITSCFFNNNYAYNDSVFGKGGAIYLYAGTLLLPSIINQTKFFGNIADMSGGAITTLTTPPIIDSSQVTFSQNKANVYGNDISAYAIELMLWTNETIEQINYEVSIDSANKTIYREYSITTRSGVQDNNLSFALLDMFGQIVKEDSSSQLYFVLLNHSNASNYYISTVPYYSIASRGIYKYFAGSEIIYKSGSNATTIPKATGLANFSGWKTAVVTINFTFLSCQLGEIYQNTTCNVCPNHYYSVSLDPFFPGPCLECDPDALCLGGDVVTPKPGFWRKNNTATIVTECPNYDACNGSSNLIQYGNNERNCSIGYYGNLCNNCELNYAKLNETSCYSCNDPVYYLIALISSLIKVFLIVDTIRSTLRATGSKDMQKLEIRKAVYLKILVNYVQLMMYAGNFGIRWPSTTSSSFTFLAKFSFTMDIASVECVNASTGVFSLTNIFYIKSLVTMMMPMILVSGCCLLALLEYSQFPCLKKINNLLSSKKINIISTLLVILVYYSQTVLDSAFSIFQCRNLYRNDEPEYYILRSPNLQCFTDTHKIWSITVATPIIILWGIVIPISLAVVIRKDKSKLDHHETQKKLSFVVKGYKQSFPSILWESYYILRKLIMVIVVVFTPLISISFSISLCIAITIIALLIQVHYEPFTDSIPNRLEKLSIGSALIVYFAGSYFEANLDSKYDFIIVSIMLIGIFSFIAYWSLHFMRLFAVIIQGKIGKFLLRVLKNPENLHRDQIEEKKILELTNHKDLDKMCENDDELLLKNQNMAEINGETDSQRDIPEENISLKDFLMVHNTTQGFTKKSNHYYDHTKNRFGVTTTEIIIPPENMIVDSEDEEIKQYIKRATMATRLIGKQRKSKRTKNSTLVKSHNSVLNIN